MELKKKFKIYGSDIITFYKWQFMVDIAKILTIFYKDNTSFPLNNGTKYYYIYATMRSAVTVDCCIFSIYSYFFERSIFCNTCNDKIEKDK